MTQNSNLSGNQIRKMKSASRLYAVQALFQMEHSSQTTDLVIREFLDFRFGEVYEEGAMMDGDMHHFRKVVEDAVNHQAAIDQLTDRALVAKWPLGRIDPTLRGLFRAASAELLHGDAPAKVVISEYVGVAAAFFPDGKESKFVNAVLDHMAHEVKPEDF